MAKGYLRAEMLLSGEDSGARMSRIGASLLLHGEVLSVDEVLDRIEAVTREQVPRWPASWPRRPRTMSAVGSLRRRGLRGPPARVGRPSSLTSMFKVGVVGAGGRMGQEVCRAVTEAPDMELVAAVDPAHVGDDACGRTIVGEVNALCDLGRRGGGRLHRGRGGAPQRAPLRPAGDPRGHRDHRAVRATTWPTLAQQFGGSGRQRHRGGQLRHRRGAADALLPAGRAPHGRGRGD